MLLLTTKNILRTLCLLLAAAVVASSLCGLLLTWPYTVETGAWRQQAVGQDLVNLCVVSPALIIVAVKFYKSKAHIAWLAGLNLYTVYTFIIYCFTIHFSALFLLYCLILAISFYALLLTVYYGLVVHKQTAPVDKWVNAGAIFIIVVGVVFYCLWMLDILSALIAHRLPNNLIETGLFTNPVHVLDLSIVLPGCIISGIMALKKNVAAIFLMQLLLIFMGVMDITIAYLSIFAAPAPPRYAVGIFMLLLAASSFLLGYKSMAAARQPV